MRLAYTCMLASSQHLDGAAFSSTGCMHLKRNTMSPITYGQVDIVHGGGWLGHGCLPIHDDRALQHCNNKKWNEQHGTAMQDNDNGKKVNTREACYSIELHCACFQCWFEANTRVPANGIASSSRKSLSKKPRTLCNAAHVRGAWKGLRATLNTIKCEWRGKEDGKERQKHRTTPYVEPRSLPPVAPLCTCFPPMLNVRSVV